MFTDGTSDTGGTFWDAVKGTYAAFDKWSADVFSTFGNTIAHPVDTLSGAGKEVIAPIADFFSSTLWKVIWILGLGLVIYFIVKKEVS